MSRFSQRRRPKAAEEEPAEADRRDEERPQLHDHGPLDDAMLVARAARETDSAAAPFSSEQMEGPARRLAVVQQLGATPRFVAATQQMLSAVGPCKVYGHIAELHAWLLAEGAVLLSRDEQWGRDVSCWYLNSIVLFFRVGDADGAVSDLLMYMCPDLAAGQTHFFELTRAAPRPAAPPRPPAA